MQRLRTRVLDSLAAVDAPDWDALAARLQGFDAEFLIEPRIRFRGQPGEQATMFVRDPSGNALEFKSFPNDSGIFATR